MENKINTSTTVYLIRHGLVHNPNKTFYGRLTGFGLSSIGKAGARSMGIHLAGKSIAAIYSSPLLRARQTANLIANEMEFPGNIRINGHLNEINTPFDGQPLHKLDERNWDIYTGNLAPYEQPMDVFTRGMGFIRKVLKYHPGQEIVAVTHADVIVYLLLWANGYPISFASKNLIEQHAIPILFPAPASMVTMTWLDGSLLPVVDYYPND